MFGYVPSLNLIFLKYTKPVSVRRKMFQSTKKPGNISSAFSSELSNFVWPSKFKDLKDDINPQNVESSWKRLVESFEIETEEIQKRGPNIIPELDFKEIQANNGTIPPILVDEVKKRGVLVVRNVVDRHTALQYKKDVGEYISKNVDQIIGFPGEIISRVVKG